MYKRILVAVDTSPTGQRALETAITLARDAGATLRIVHAIDTISVNLGIEFPLQADATGELMKRGEALLADAAARAEAVGVPAETALLTVSTLELRVAEALAADADTWNADLVVVGTHGRRGLSRLFLGSVAEGIARIANVPVLLIRAK
ncbi:MAG TPA: universal stress protein [Thiobacillaceae bacterium]|nr:universal stress protein [Thiobacillaceae bacterium]